MKKTVSILLVCIALGFIVLLFWPFAQWNDVMSVVLRVVPALAIQALICRIGKWNIIKAIPVVCTGAFAAWGTYLYFTSPHWAGATALDLIADYFSPFAACVLVFIPYLFFRKK